MHSPVPSRIPQTFCPVPSRPAEFSFLLSRPVPRRDGTGRDGIGPASRGALYQAHIDELINRIHEKSASVHYPIDDPDDRVDIDQWNELNDEAIQRVPEITDYSDEHNAVRWLKWFVPIIERYQQVRSDERTAR